MHPIHLRRIYDDHRQDEGLRILIDRLWPRGISKEHAKLDDWMKEIAPSSQLRHDYHQHQEDFEEFSAAYRKELAHDPEKQAALEKLVALSKKDPVILLYGAKDAEHSNAAVLLKYLKAHYPVKVLPD